MSNIKSLFPVFILGSVWGLIEILHLPIAVVSGLAILFLAMNRVISPVSGAGIILGLIVCFYKTYSDNFFICQWMGVMSIAISFEILSFFLWRDDLKSWPSLSLLGLFTGILACAIFASVLIFITHHPYWVAGGWPRVLSYFWKDMLPAGLIGLVATPAGAYLGKLWKENQQIVEGKFALGISTGVVLIVWIVASIHRFK
jgi:hypothetical protein